jgi:adenosine deaminase
MTYKEAGVPIVLASDDPGVERTDLTAQYETAASLYPGLAYQDFKEFARNSLNYSFLEEEEKGDLQHQLEEDFAAFEGRMSLLAVSAVA